MPYQRLFTTLADLPILSFGYDVQQFMDDPTKRVLIVNAAMGSGKTLCVPILIAEHRPTARIVVLEPNKFIAGEAVEDILELTQLPPHNMRVSAAYVGDSTDTSVSVGMKRRTTVTYSTYAYALNNSMVETADVVICDEAQDQSLDQTAVLSVIRKRMDNQHPVKLIIMSATMAVDDHETDWDAYGVTTLQTGEHMHPCRDEWVKPKGRFGAQHDELGDQVLRLHLEGCRGILVFVDTLSDVDGVKRYIEQQDVDHQLDIHTLVGRSTYADRCAIRAFPKSGQTRVLIGTRVLEAGLNLAWADAGISTGIGTDRELNARTMTVETVRRPLCQHRLEHQRGRVARFRPGRFVLLHHQSFTDRPIGVVPEVHRLPLDALVLHCASLGLVATQLDFVPAVDTVAVTDAQEQLIAYGVVTEKQHLSGKPMLQISKMGRIAQRAGLSMISGLMLQEAARLKLLHLAIPLVATYEVGDLRLKRGALWTADTELSDILTQVVEYCTAHRSYMEIFTEPAHDRRAVRRVIKEAFTHNNWSVKLYLQTQNLIRRLERELSTETDYAGFSDDTINDTVRQLRQVLLVSSLHQLFMLDCKTWQAINQATGVRYSLDQNSVVRQATFHPDDVVYVTGVVREIVPRNGRPSFFILGGVSYFMAYELAELVDARDDWLVETPVSGRTRHLREVSSRVNNRVLFRYQYNRHISDSTPVDVDDQAPCLDNVVMLPTASTAAEIVDDPLEALRRHFQRS